MRICVIGAGALGGTYGGFLARQGHDVSLIDIWPEHVAAIQAEGLTVGGVRGHYIIRLPAYQPEDAPLGFEFAIIATDTNNTIAAAEIAKHVLAPDGFAMPLQNGIGNAEILVDAIGRARVAAGSSMSSFRIDGPGNTVLTHAGPTTIGELDGSASERLSQVKDFFEAAGFETRLTSAVQAVIWQKFLLNAAINPLCAASGLRLGEIVRNPAMNALQDQIIAEALAVTAAKGIKIPDADIRRTIKWHCWHKYSKPSMLQHIDAGRKTEIDAINGALVREGRRLGIATPANAALTAMVKGREQAAMLAVKKPERDYDALEREIGEFPESLVA